MLIKALLVRSFKPGQPLSSVLVVIPAKGCMYCTAISCGYLKLPSTTVCFLQQGPCDGKMEKLLWHGSCVHGLSSKVHRQRKEPMVPKTWAYTILFGCPKLDIRFFCWVDEAQLRLRL